MREGHRSHSTSDLKWVYQGIVNDDVYHYSVYNIERSRPTRTRIGTHATYLRESCDRFL